MTAPVTASIFQTAWLSIIGKKDRAGAVDMDLPGFLIKKGVSMWYRKDLFTVACGVGRPDRDDHGIRVSRQDGVGNGIGPNTFRL